MSTIIRKGCVDDLENLHYLYKNYKNVLHRKNDNEKLIEYLKKIVDQHCMGIYWCEVEQLPVGFITYQLYSSASYLKDCMFIVDLWVEEEYRNQGIATQLIKECEELAIRIKSPAIYIAVLENNQLARRLYSELNFKYDGLQILKRHC